MIPARYWKVKERGQRIVRFAKPQTEAPVNGGCNYNSPKVNVKTLACSDSDIREELPTISVESLNIKDNTEGSSKEPRRDYTLAPGNGMKI